MKRVLLTGASGAIGCHMLAHIMETTDWEVVATDSFKSEHKGYFDRLPELTKPEYRSRIKIITHDLTAPFTAREIKDIGHIDYVINLASRSDVQNSIDDPVTFVRNNTELMLNMLEYARAAKPEVFLHFSTDEVYGAIANEIDCTTCYNKSGSMSDGSYRPCHAGCHYGKLKQKGHAEWDPIVPSNPYSASKASQEALGVAWWRSYGVPLIITNTMNNFGETQAPSKFPAMIQQKLEKDETITVHAANGEVGTRFYIHSRNVADAVIFILKNVPVVHHQFGEIDRPVRLNIVGDKQVSNLELVETIARLMGKTPKIELVNYHANNPGHDLHYGLDGTKLKKLGWTSPVSFEDSLKRTIEWQRRNPNWMLY